VEVKLHKNRTGVLRADVPKVFDRGLGVVVVRSTLDFHCCESAEPALLPVGETSGNSSGYGDAPCYRQQLEPEDDVQKQRWHILHPRQLYVGYRETTPIAQPEAGSNSPDYEWHEKFKVDNGHNP